MSFTSLINFYGTPLPRMHQYGYSMGTLWCAFSRSLITQCKSCGPSLYLSCNYLGAKNSISCGLSLHESKLFCTYAHDVSLSIRMHSHNMKRLVNVTEIREDVNSRRCVPNRKRGKRTGIRVRTRLRGRRRPLPTIVLGNVRSIRNKTDELTARCNFNSEYRDSSLICLTQTWLKHRDSDVTVNNFSLVINDRDLTSKHRGGGLAIYINERWCINFTIKDKHCENNL